MKRAKRNKSKHAQGSLEYLIIIAAVLVVAGVVVFFVSGAAGGGKSSALYSSCQEAATKCRAKHLVNPDDPCNFCDTSCVDMTSGEEIFEGAITCCKLGNSSGIFEGSLGCGEISCSPGQTLACNTSTNCPGKRECISGAWGPCSDIPNDGCPATCGDNIISGAEECDGTNLNGETCVTQGFTSGTLTCVNCAFNTAGCCLLTEATEKTCNDSKDNDCDGRIDCGDADCAGDPYCTGVPPNAAFTYNCTGSTCSFNATSSNDPDGAIVSYSWNFSGEGIDFKVLAEWNFTTQGYRDVTLTVTDNKGMKDTETKSVFANNAPAFYGAGVTPNPGAAGSTFTYSVYYKDADNKTPSFVRVIIDGTSTYDMTKQSPSCVDYAAGCNYIYQKVFSTISTHNYYYNMSDGFNETIAGPNPGPNVVQCTTASHCNDGNPCTNDLCSSYVCSHTNVVSGTSCGTTTYSSYYCCGNTNCAALKGTTSKCRSVTTYACNGEGSCVSSTTTETTSCGSLTCVKGSCVTCPY
ncbi:MAG: PKD domain-containing protein [archaeon]